MTDRVDLKRALGTYAAKQGVFSTVVVPPLQYLMVDGHGDPNTAPAYSDALAALYPVAYRMRFLSRVELGRDYTVMPLEGLWWSDDLAAFTGTTRDKSRWDWTLMILVPDWLGLEHVDAAKAAVARKQRPASLDTLRLDVLDEGRSVQTLHLGPYDDEAAALAALHRDFLPAQGLRPVGKHHEIYLSDARRTAPERLRTILRQPVSVIATG